MTDQRSRRWLFGRPPCTRRSSSGCSSWSYSATTSNRSCVSRSQSHDSRIPGDDRSSLQRWWVHGSCCGACRIVYVPSHPDLKVLETFVCDWTFSLWFIHLKIHFGHLRKFLWYDVVTIFTAPHPLNSE